VEYFIYIASIVVVILIINYFAKIGALKRKNEEKNIHISELIIESINNVKTNIKSDYSTKNNNNLRHWYGKLFAELQSNIDESRIHFLRTKKRPALTAAEQLREIKNEKKVINSKLKIIEYQLKTYEQHFPIIEDFKEYILEDDNFFLDLNEEKEVDPSKKYLNPDEFKKLPADERNQLALNKYISKNHTKLEIGRLYERYIGYLYEKDNWVVKFIGIIEGFEDLGRDLICTKDNEVHIVQCKNWSQRKEIREKHLYQLFATSTHYKITQQINSEKIVTPVFYSTTNYSEMAKKVASALGIKDNIKKLSKEYPMIKCNINPTTNEKIFHLPFDQQYDKIIIGNNDGEFYASTVKEAVDKGFRRAFRYRGPA